jgi:hypothetical protein
MSRELEPLEPGGGMTRRQMETENENIGNHWFEAGSMRFFRSRVSDTIYTGADGWYFVSSEQAPNAKRKYSVRRFNLNRSVHTVGEFGAYSTNARAQKAAARIAKESFNQ